MENNILIKSAAKKTSKTGKEYLEVLDANNNRYSCWEVDDFGDFMPNTTVNVEITQKGDFKNIKIAGKVREQKKYQPKASNVAQAQDRKAEMVKTAQERTSESVKMAGSARDASLILTAFHDRYSNFSEEQLKEKWEEWRKFLFSKYDEPFVG